MAKSIKGLSSKDTRLGTYDINFNRIGDWMYNYSITKYKGILDLNIYKEWGAISDIGKIYNGKKLTMDEYKKTEDAYIEALFIILKYMNIKTLKLKNMSFARYKHDFFKGTESLYSESMLHTYMFQLNLLWEFYSYLYTYFQPPFA